MPGSLNLDMVENYPDLTNSPFQIPLAKAILKIIHHNYQNGSYVYQHGSRANWPFGSLLEHQFETTLICRLDFQAIQLVPEFD